MVRTFVEHARAEAPERKLLEVEEDVPESLEYLYAIFLRLHSMREYDMNGPRRFTPSHILAGVALFGWDLSPNDVDALVHLDAVVLNPGPRDDAKPSVDSALVASLAPIDAWPAKKPPVSDIH